MRRSLSTPLFALTAACAALAAPGARASGLLVARFGGEWGHPTTDHLSALYYNPAGLSLLGETRLTLSGIAALRFFTFDRDPGAIDNILVDPAAGTGTPAGDGVAANAGEATLTNVIGTPFFAVGTDFGVDGLGAALGLFVPIGGQTIFDKREASDAFPGAVDSPARWWTIEGTARSIYGSAAVAYRIAPIRLSIGLALDVVYTETDNIQARNADGTDHLVSNGRLVEGRVLVDVSAIDLGLGVGLLWEPVEHLFVGLSYRSQPGFGEQRLEGEASLALGGGPLGDDLVTKALLSQEMPDVVRFGVRWTEPKRWEARLFGTYARWSVLDKQCVLSAETPGASCTGIGKILALPRFWHDAFEIRAGGSTWLSDGVELTFGAGFDGNAVPDSTVEPAFYDTEKVTLTVGVRAELTSALKLEATFTQVIYPDRTVAPRGRVPLDDANPDGPQISDIEGLYDAALRTPDAAGTYSQAISVLEIGLSYSF